MLLCITRRLPRDRYRCGIVTFRTHPSIGDLSEFPCPVHVLPMRRTYGWKALQAARVLRHLIRSQRASIVHTFFETADLWGGLVARWSGVPVLVSSRRDLGTQRSGKHALGYRLLGRLFDQVQAVSGSVRDFCISTDGFPPEKVVTVHNGVELPSSAQPMEAFEIAGISRAADLIATVGHVKRVKGYDVLIQAAGRVVAEFPRAVFAIIGDIYDKAYFDELQVTIRSLGISENIRFLGKRADVLPILRQAKVFTLLSRSEGLCNALLEAMACGLPCVATNVGGNPELVQDESTGFLVPNGDAAMAANRILRLLRDEPRAREMGNSARRTAETRFSTDNMIRKLVAEYDRLLELKSASLQRQSYRQIYDTL
jgi:L-malate glycosyltransferase